MLVNLRITLFLLQKVKRGAVKHYWFGDGNLNPCHHLPDEFIKRISSDPGMSRFAASIVNKWVDEREIDQGFVDEVVETIASNAPQPTVYLVCIGSENIRQRPNKTEVEEVFSRHHAIAEAVSETEGACLLIVSPIPSTITEEVAPIVEELDVKLGKLNNGERVLYVGFRRKHFPVLEDGSRFDANFFDDTDHLNRAGAAKLAREITCNLNSLPNRAFNLKPMRFKSKLKAAAHNSMRERARTLGSGEPKQLFIDNIF